MKNTDQREGDITDVREKSDSLYESVLLGFFSVVTVVGIIALFTGVLPGVREMFFGIPCQFLKVVGAC